jgi:hypothetical protein
MDNYLDGDRSVGSTILGRSAENYEPIVHSTHSILCYHSIWM